MGSAAVQGTLWSKRAGDWAKLQEPKHLLLFQRALEAIEPLAGKTLLDAGCGSGLALELALARGAVISGVDAASALVDIARKRLPQANLQVGDIETLPFDDRSFDRVCAFNSVQYAADPMHALRELRRVARQEARVLIGQWGEAARCDTEPLFAKLRALAPPPPGTPAPLALTGDGRLEMLLVDAGMRPERWGEAVCPWHYPSLESAWLALASAGPLVRVLDVAGNQAVYDAFREVFEPFVQPDGTVLQHNVFRWIVSSV